VKIELSETTADAMLAMLAMIMDGGSIELLSDDVRPLAILKLSDPAAEPPSGGELVFNSITEEDAALAQGTAETARVLGADGGEIFSCDVGDSHSDAVIKLNTTRIFRGGPVRLTSFRLTFQGQP
jgi:hypothetical protein